jgi:hypothetical protein
MTVVEAKTINIMMMGAWSVKPWQAHIAHI